MEALALLGAVAAAVFVARELLRRLGWPTRFESAARWGVLLLGLGLAFAALPTLCHGQSFGSGTGHTPIDSLELIAILSFAGVAIIGYISWRRREPLREAARRRAERARSHPRRRALPPPPEGFGHPPGVFGPPTPGEPPEGEE